MPVIRRAGRSEPVCERSELRVPGDHNLANVLAACAAADAVGVPTRAMREAIRAFTGVPHRLELVRSLEGVSYYNDSIATSPDRVRAALAAIPGPVLLILGGHDKALPWEELCREAVRRCRAVLVLGEAEYLIADHLAEARHAAPSGLFVDGGRSDPLRRSGAGGPGGANAGPKRRYGPALARLCQLRSIPRFRGAWSALPPTG